MPNTKLIIGGCRSGKSSHALSLGDKFAGQRNIFVATCQPHDAEMEARIQRHQLERGRHWQTVESPIDLAGAIGNHGPKGDILLIDCLTLWVSNLMTAHDRDEDIMQEMRRLEAAIAAPPCPIILVTNEVGAGIVPENPLARRFRDLTGWCNQKMAVVCDDVVWMVAGIAVPIKSSSAE